VVSRIL